MKGRLLFLDLGAAVCPMTPKLWIKVTEHWRQKHDGEMVFQIMVLGLFVIYQGSWISLNVLKYLKSVMVWVGHVMLSFSLGVLLCFLGMVWFSWISCLLFTLFPALLWRSVLLCSPVLCSCLVSSVHLPDCLNLRLFCSRGYLSLVFSPIPRWFIYCCFFSFFLLLLSLWVFAPWRPQLSFVIVFCWTLLPPDLLHFGSKL